MTEKQKYSLPRSRREGLNHLFSDQIIRRSSVHPLAVRMVPLYRFRPVCQYTTMVLSYSDGILKFTVAKTCRIPYNSSIQTNKRKENGKNQNQKNPRCSASQAFGVKTNARSAPESTPERLRLTSNRKGCWNTLVLGCQNPQIWYNSLIQTNKGKCL